MIQPLATAPDWPRQRDRGIGCVGAGFIMRDCHLVAYRAAGFRPVAITSRTRSTAEQVAAQHGIPRVHATLDDLLDDAAVEILDVAVPPQAQPGVIRRALEKGHSVRAILAQKPLALNVAEARELVEACESAGVLLAVNQNMRYDQAVRGLKSLLDQGVLGEVVLATIEMRAVPHWMPWSRGLPSLATFVMSGHHLDTFRYWLGTPDRVLASTRPDPRTDFAHRDGVNLYILEYEHGPRAAAWDDVWAGPVREGAAAETFVRWRVEGTCGTAIGTVGWPRWPESVPSTLDYTTRDGPHHWHRPRWSEAWFPDAFAGPMAELLVALEGGPPPNLSGRDNLATIALCQAVYAAATEHRVTTVREFLGGSS
jgi:predicted dehydrogenase